MWALRRASSPKSWGSMSPSISSNIIRTSRACLPEVAAKAASGHRATLRDQSSSREDRPLGDVAEIAVHGCILGLLNRQYRIRVRPADGSPAKVVVRFDPKGTPVLHWLDIDRLQAVLGDVRSLTPQIAQAGPVHITFIYRGANPSLD